VELRALFNQNELENKSEIQKRNYLSQAGRRLRRKLEKLLASLHLMIVLPISQSVEELSNYPKPIERAFREGGKNIYSLIEDIENTLSLAQKRLKELKAQENK